MSSPTPQQVVQLANLSMTQIPVGSALLSPPVLDPSIGDLAQVRGEQAVLQSILTILNTRQGEVQGMENLGTVLPLLLFEPVDGFLDVAPGNIKDALLAFEPRLATVAVSVTRDPNDSEQVLCYISWTYRRYFGPTSTTGQVTLAQQFTDPTGGQPTGWQVQT